MSARAPDAIRNLWFDVQRLVPQAVLSGIVGDTAHSFGYHLARRDLPSSDYSVHTTLDRRGASDCASALDISLSPDLMQKVTRRLHAAAVNRDPRLKALREFCGTLDGSHTYPWDLYTNTSEGIDTWDDSHLWHVHLSFYRAYADDYAALAPIAQVIAGVSITKEFTVDATAQAAFDALNRRLDALAADVSAVKADIANGVNVVGLLQFDHKASPTIEAFLSGIPGYTAVARRPKP